MGRPHSAGKRRSQARSEVAARGVVAPWVPGTGTVMAGGGDRRGLQTSRFRRSLRPQPPRGCSRQRPCCSSFCLSFFLKSVVILKSSCRGPGRPDTDWCPRFSQEEPLVCSLGWEARPFPALRPAWPLAPPRRPHPQKGLESCRPSAGHSTSAGTCTQTQAVRFPSRAFPKSHFLVCPDL